MNGAVEAANKNIKKIIQKMVVTYRDVIIRSSRIPHYSQDLDRDYPIFFGIRYGGSDAVGSGNPIVKSINGF